MSLDLDHLLSWEVRTESGSPSFPPVPISLLGLQPQAESVKVEAEGLAGVPSVGAKGEGSQEQDTPHTGNRQWKAFPTIYSIKNLCFSRTSWGHFFPACEQGH